MTEARAVLPTDLLALVSYNGRSYQNEAWTRERLGAVEANHPFGLVLDQFLAFAKGRSAWISVHHQRLQGLVGARQRGGRAAWEIDYLIDATPDKEVIAGLLECAIAETGRSGAEKLFLRLAADSELVSVVCETGFLAFREEVLYGGRFHASTAATLRPASPSDSYLLYRFYNQVTPEITRRSEAATYGEWQAAQERRWLKGGVVLLSERDDQVTAVVRAARLAQGVCLELLTSEVSLDEVGAIVTAAVEAVDGAGPVFVLAAAQDEALARRLSDCGLTPRGEFVSLMRRTTRPLTLPKLTPAIAKNAIGV